MRLKKAIRTAQSSFRRLKQPKDLFYLWSRRLLRIPHERDFRALALISRCVEGCYVDVGANHGQSVESIKLCVPEARIVAFEPNVTLAGRLIQRYRGDRRIEIRGVGLADKPAQMVLHVPSYRGFVYDGLSSLDRDAAASWISPDTVYFFRPELLSIDAIECRIETLDEQNLDPAFIKIDVQGTEYNVVRGGLDTIRRCHPVLLIEDLRGDPRLMPLMVEQGYVEFSFSGTRLAPGQPRGPNSFLIHRTKLSALRDVTT